MGDWISIKDRWPEPKQDVLAILDSHNDSYSGSMRVLRFSPFDYLDGHGPYPEFSMPGFGGLTITYWMPLPEPPKEVANEKG